MAPLAQPETTFSEQCGQATVPIVERLWLTWRRRLNQKSLQCDQAAGLRLTWRRQLLSEREKEKEKDLPPRGIEPGSPDWEFASLTIRLSRRRQAAAIIRCLQIRLRRLFGGGDYSRAAIIGASWLIQEKNLD